MTIDHLKTGLDALFDLAATGPDKLQRRDCDQEGARRYEALNATVDGLAVTHLQTALRALGQDVPIDGCFGGATQDALLEMLGQPDFDQARGDTEKLRDAIWAKAVLLVRQTETNNGADTHTQDGKSRAIWGDARACGEWVSASFLPSRSALGRKGAGAEENHAESRLRRYELRDVGQALCVQRYHYARLPRWCAGG